MALGKRKRNFFNPDSEKSFQISRSKLEDFIRCPRCFYLDRRLGISRPSIPAFTLNSAVDHLLKKEFDHYRRKEAPHPLMRQYHINAIPFWHPELDEWRENFKGVRVHHAPTGLTVFGAIDDLWLHENGNLMVVDYKSTSKDGEVALDDPWKSAYKRQMEIYQWLLRQKGFTISNTGYFVYANARRDPVHFQGNLSFSVSILPYEGNADWVEKTIFQAHECLNSESLPTAAEDCEYCAYRAAAREVE
ncbi:MAG: PD-(D/E)XK nuclease family protein [bacterium]